MPKRSAEHKIERYKKKIRKLERKRTRVIFSESSSSDIEAHEDRENESISAQAQETPDLLDMAPATANLSPDIEIPPEDTVAENAAVAPADSGAGDPTSEHKPEASATDKATSDETAASTDVTPTLDPDLLSALGESTDSSPDFGDKILDNLAKLWLPLLKKGMPKENKEKLLKEYLVPDNCRLLQAPKLNAEISAAVPDMVRNRDKNITTAQQQLGSGITAINRAMDILLQNDDKVQVIKHLSDACRILSDLHAMSTQNRIKLITPSLDKTFLHVIQDAERDDTIFGNKLSDKIKAAKTIERQGLQIKKTVPKTSAPTQPTNSRPSYSGNWSAPPRYQSNRGGRGGTKKPAPPNTRRPYAAPQQASKPANSSKPRAPAQ